MGKPMIICFEDHQEIIDCYNEAGRPMDSDTIQLIKDTAKELVAKGFPGKWLVFQGECRICSFDHDLLICPASVDDIENLECSNCGNMTVQPKEYNEWEDV